jgi:transcriptional regulator
MTRQTDVLQGTLTLLILKTLANGPKHGYAITQQILRGSEEVLRVEEGSLYPALHRMEQQGWIISEWGLTQTNRKARFYSLTRTGKAQLKAEEENWQRLTIAVNQVLRFT